MRELEKIVLCAPVAMKFELTRAQLTPAKFIARDGKCVFHGYLQVTIISATTLFPARAALAKVVNFPLKLPACYSNPYHANCFWLKNIIHIEHISFPRDKWIKQSAIEKKHREIFRRVFNLQ